MTSNAQALFDMHKIRATLGASLLGGLVAVFFSGIVSMQVFIYYRIYPNDRFKFKFLVGLIWFLDVLHTCMVCTVNWIYLISNYGNPGIADYIPWAVGTNFVITVAITYIIHCFFAHRIYTLSKGNWYITAPIYIFATLRLISALVTTSLMMKMKSYQTFFHTYIWLFVLGLALSAAVDTLIAAALCWYLHKSRTGFSSMDNIIDSITLYTVENGLLTCVATIASLICWVSLPDTLVFLALYFTISKLYANAFLATLNARKVLRGRSQSSSDRNNSEHPMPVLFPDNFSRFSRPFTSRHDPNEAITTKVQISVEKTIQHDGDIEPLSFSDPSQEEDSDITKDPDSKGIKSV
ncbi:hypothetical protein ABKN59_004750 [Abortiporus biennis]